ncbi:MAG: hypothetical protein QME27_08780, partial [Syntrophaceae bacterium]|nr:hypothetical protein [Syntrophaceae bacterium]
LKKVPIGDSAPNRPLIPIQIGHPIRLKSATDSEANRPGIPIQIGRAFRSKSATPLRGKVTLDN